MKNFWKWILGIVIVMVVLFGLGIGARLLMGNFLPNWSGEVDGFRHPMMAGRGLYPFGGMTHFGGGMIRLGGLVPLVLIGLLAYGAYRLGTRKNTAFQPPASPGTPLTCPNCGQPVLENWKHCANCGKEI